MMATGYTHPVVSGEITTLREFVLRCARGMGAAVMMRDEPLDKPIPERFEASTSYHDEKIAKARAALEELPALSADDADKRADEEFAAAMARHVEYEAEETAGYERLKRMHDEVRTWKTKAGGIKDFMLGQLNLTIGRGPYQSEPPVRMTAEDWRRKAMEKASRDLAYHEVERAKEIERTEERNRWLADLRASLPAEPDATSDDTQPGMETLQASECTKHGEGDQ